MADNGPALHPGAALADDCSLFVPMRLQAVSVPADTNADDWADLTPQYDELAAETVRAVGRHLHPRPFDRRSKPLLRAGIHLHWTLPAAFTHIEHKKGEKAYFPPVPNRWLVVRLSEQNPGKLGYRAQIVESDYLGNDGTSSWLRVRQGSKFSPEPARWPWKPDEPPTVTEGPRELWARDKIGRAVDLDKYGEPGSAFAAVAPGNLSFASFYPSCRNVFGYHDRQSGSQSQVFSYFVVGWFFDPAKDPLHGCKGKADWVDRMARLGWTVPENTEAPLPKRILCHGAIDSVTWPPTSRDIVGKFANFDLAAGNDAIEAIAALLSKQTATQAVLRERLLGQLQFALLQDRLPAPYEVRSKTLQQRQDLTPLRSKRHEKTFTALPGGTRWEIDQPTRNGAQAPRQNPPVVKLPEQLAKGLADINRYQRDYDLKQRQLVALQREIYFQWHRARLLETMSLTDEDRGNRISALNQRRQEAEKALQDLLNDLKEPTSEIARIADDLRRALAADPAWRGHVLTPRPMPRFWRPNDPTLLMAGVNTPAIQGGKLPLVCRLTGKTVSSFSPRGADFGTFDVQADALKNESVVKELLSNLPAGIPSGIPDLLCEALLLDPLRVQLLARVARRAGPRSIEDVAGPVKQRLAHHLLGDFTIGTQRASDRGASTAFDTALSATVFETSSFKPVFMVWQARYLPAGGQSDLELWDFDADGVDCVWRGASPTSETRSAGYVDYWGYAPLGDSVGRGLQSKTPRPHEIDDRIIGLVVQSIGGFTEALLLRDSALQLPPLKADSAEIDEATRQLIGDQYAVAPLVEHLDKDRFFPIRSGHLVLRRLWVVDTFGRVRRVLDDDKDASVCTSHSLAVAGSPQLMRLPPRLAQPARLLLRWLSADKEEQEFLGDIATQPICGWIIHNRLDRSLLVCDASGQPAGAVQSVIHTEGHDRRGIRWTKLPLQPIEADDIPNRHLRGFVKGLLSLAGTKGECTSTAFEDFLRLIRHIEDNEPQQPQHQGLSVLMGRPLALLRASLRLDLLGPPAVDQSWSQLKAKATAEPGFTGVEFDVRLGNRRKGPDGLIGYFSADDYKLIRLAQHAEDWSPTADQKGHQYFRANQSVRVTCNPSARPELLTLLLDPHLGVHISSGILPTKMIDLPSDLVSDALSKLELPLLVAPVLGERQPEGIPNIPLPGDMPGKWIWTWRPKPDVPAKFNEVMTETAQARSLFKTMAIYEGWLGLRLTGAKQK